MARGRWNYMSRPGFNPPNDACPECKEPSRTHHIGDRTVEGLTTSRFRCENGHTWVTHEQAETTTNR